jgi:hypothetical protein
MPSQLAIFGKLARCLLLADCVAKFLRPNRATLIQERTQTGNIDSKRRSGRFDCCALAIQGRVLQHNRHLADIAWTYVRRPIERNI